MKNLGLIIIVALVVLGFNALFVVAEGNKAIVIQFGKVHSNLIRVIPLLSNKLSLRTVT